MSHSLAPPLRSFPEFLWISPQRAGDGAAGVKASIALFLSVVLAGCASGAFFWTRADATPEAFNTDHAECAKGAMIGYGVGSEKAYKACMSQKGWTRVQGSGNQPPDVSNAHTEPIRSRRQIDQMSLRPPHHHVGHLRHEVSRESASATA